jgi:beta-carotene ketolase (CrtO type)
MASGETYDALIIGGGHNGLACACYLARAGLTVVVVEQYHVVGGMTLTEELTAPGFRSDVHASGYQLANISPTPAELGLDEHGLELCEPGFAWAHAFPGGEAIAIGADLERARASIARFSPTDAETAVGLFGEYREQRKAVIEGLFSPPPRLSEQLAAMESTEGGLDRYRLSLQSMRSWANETFVSEEVKCLFGAFAPFVGHGPDDAAGAEIAWLFASVLQTEGNKLVRGGMHNVSLALAAKLRSLGGVIRTGERVERIEVAGGRATGVALAGGERIGAGELVAASIDAAQLGLQMLGEEVIGGGAAERLRRLEWGDSVMVIHTALENPVPYAAGGDADAAAHVHLSQPSVDAMARAIDECRAGMLPQEPVIVSWNDSQVDPGRAPRGRALKKFVVLGVPYEIRGDATERVGSTDWDECRERYADHVLELVDEHYLPGLREEIIARAVHSPLDLERKLPSAVRGTIPHGAMVPYQSGPLRPTPDFAGYRSPIENVYLCGSGSHPGAGVSMAAGRNAATVICTERGLTGPGTA